MKNLKHLSALTIILALCIVFNPKTNLFALVDGNTLEDTDENKENFIDSNLTDETSVNDTNKKLFIKITNPETRIRNSVWGDIIDFAKVDNVYQVIESINDSDKNTWYKIQNNSETGYIFASEKYCETFYEDQNKIINDWNFDNQNIDSEYINGNSLEISNQNNINSNIQNINGIEEKTETQGKVFDGKIKVILYPNQNVYSIGQVLNFDFKDPAEKGGQKFIKKPMYYFESFKNNKWELSNKYDPDCLSDSFNMIVDSNKIRVRIEDKEDKSKIYIQEIDLNVIKKDFNIQGLEDKTYTANSIINFSLQSNNIKNPQYQVHISKDDKTVYFSDYSANSIYNFIPKTDGDYLLTVLAKDLNGNNGTQLIKSANIVISSNSELGFYTNVTNRSYMNAPIIFNIVDKQNFSKYKLSYILNDNELVINDNITEKTFSFEPTIEGDYTFVLSAFNQYGKMLTFSKPIKVKKITSSINFSQNPSNNLYKTRYGFVPSIIVSHISEGTYESAISWLKNKKSDVSSNFVVAKDGRVTELISVDNGAWANGTESNPSKNASYYNSKLDEVKERKTNANFYTVSIENEGVHSITNGALSIEQQNASIELIKYIRNEVKRIYNKSFNFDRKTFVGHSDINSVSRPNCPGVLYPFDSIIQSINE